MDLFGRGRTFSAGGRGEGRGGRRVKTSEDDPDHISQAGLTMRTPSNPEPDWGQLSRGGVEWVGSISQCRKWGGGCLLRSSRDRVLAFQIAPVPSGEEVTREKARKSRPPICDCSCLGNTAGAGGTPTSTSRAGGFRGWSQDARG